MHDRAGERRDRGAMDARPSSPAPCARRGLVHGTGSRSRHSSTPWGVRAVPALSPCAAVDDGRRRDGQWRPEMEQADLAPHTEFFAAACRIHPAPQGHEIEEPHKRSAQEQEAAQQEEHFHRRINRRPAGNRPAPLHRSMCRLVVGAHRQRPSDHLILHNGPLFPIARLKRARKQSGSETRPLALSRGLPIG